MQFTKKALIIVGTSGVGKGTVLSQLFPKHPQIFKFVLSYTTRPPRENQVDNIHYRFVTPEQFEAKYDDMLENKIVFNNSYGTCKTHYEQILRENKIPVLDIDLQGMLEVKDKIQCQVVCIMPPSWEILQNRLKGRNSESEQAFKNRMKGNYDLLKRMYELQGKSKIHYVTNFQCQLTAYGIERWIAKKFPVFDQYLKKQTT